MGCARPARHARMIQNEVKDLLVQAVALGTLPNIAAGRAAMAMSYEQTTYEPRPLGDWDAAIIRFDALVGAATAS